MSKTRNFLMVKKTRKNTYGDVGDVIIMGMIQSDTYPSGITNDKNSPYYLCDIHEVTENCHINLVKNGK